MARETEKLRDWREWERRRVLQEYIDDLRELIDQLRRKSVN